MAERYEALPGGDGGAWVATEPPAPRHLLPVAQSTAGQPIDGQFVVRTVEVRLGDPYQGLVATMRKNPRRSVLDGLRSGETEQAITAAYALIVRWNLRNEETGEPIPLTREEVYDLPDDLLAALLRGYFESFVEATTPDKSDEASDS